MSLFRIKRSYSMLTDLSQVPKITLSTSRCYMTVDGLSKGESSGFPQGSYLLSWACAVGGITSFYSIEQTSKHLNLKVPGTQDHGVEFG